jgi:hypothetical protein
MARSAGRLLGALCCVVLAVSGCGKSGDPKAPSYLAPWPRPRYQAGGGDALVYFVLYGKFQEGAEVSARQYRSAGLPQSVDLRRLTRAEQPRLPFTDDPVSRALAKDQPALVEQMRAAPECLIFQGELKDPRDLNYLRDVIGLIMFSLEHGACAVLDVQQLKLFDALGWRREMFEPAPPRLARHVVVLLSDEGDGTLWVHTRGMRKFGRPDLSLHHVQNAIRPAVMDMFNRFVLLQAEGMRIRENQEIVDASLPPGLTCHQAGSRDDPDFNNVHVEIRWPGAK